MEPLTTERLSGRLVYGHFGARTSCELFVSRIVREPILVDRRSRHGNLLSKTTTAA